MEFNCKSPGCPGKVIFDPEDNGPVFPGNLLIQSLGHSEFLFKVGNPIKEGKKVSSLTIIQPLHADIKEQTIIIEREELKKDSFKTREIYLTCDNSVDRHTFAYQVKIEE